MWNDEIKSDPIYVCNDKIPPIIDADCVLGCKKEREEFLPATLIVKMHSSIMIRHPCRVIRNINYFNDCLVCNVTFVHSYFSLLFANIVDFLYMI